MGLFILMGIPDDKHLPASTGSPCGGLNVLYMQPEEVAAIEARRGAREYVASCCACVILVQPRRLPLREMKPAPKMSAMGRRPPKIRPASGERPWRTYRPCTMTSSDFPFEQSLEYIGDAESSGQSIGMVVW